MRPPRSLTAITLAYSCIFMGAILAASLFMYVASIRSLINELDNRLFTEASALVGDGKLDLPTVITRLRRNQGQRANADLSYLLADPHGRPLAGTLRLRLPQPGSSDVDYTDGVEVNDRGRALTTRLPDGSTLVLVADYGPVEEFDTHMLQIGGMVTLATIVIGVLGTLAFSKTISRRIEANTRIAESIMAGQLERRMPFDGSGGAFDRQAVVLNAMLERIQFLMVQLQQISSDVAHDLRTPLTRLRSDLERLDRMPASQIRPEDTAGPLARSEHLLALFGAILRISEVEGGSRRRYFGAIDLEALALEVIATMSPAIEAEGGHLGAGALESLTIDGDRELLSQALINLLDNANKYAGERASIMLSVTLQDGVASIEVRDDGPGIAAADRDNALRRFGRLDNSRSRQGNGLGLSLVEAIARLHGGRFELRDAHPGLAATLTVPITGAVLPVRKAAGLP